jgi:hypothetical protein
MTHLAHSILPRRALWLAVPGLAINVGLTILMLSDLWVNPGLPIGSECCGWAYHSWDSYRLMGLADAGWLLGCCAVALGLRDRPGLSLLLVYTAPAGLLGMNNILASSP